MIVHVLFAFFRYLHQMETSYEFFHPVPGVVLKMLQQMRLAAFVHLEGIMLQS